MPPKATAKAILLALAVSLPVVSNAQSRSDRFVVGAREFIRTQTALGAFEADWAVVSGDGAVAIIGYVEQNPLAGFRVYAQNIDVLGRELSEPIFLNPVLGEPGPYVPAVSVCRAATDSLATWVDGDADAFGCRFSDSGDPLTAVFDVTGPGSAWPTLISLVVSPTQIAAAWEGAEASCSTCAITARFFTPAGVPLSPEIGVSTWAPRNFPQRPIIGLHSDGGASVMFMRGDSSRSDIKLQRINPDYTLDPVKTLPLGQVGFYNARMLNDQSWTVIAYPPPAFSPFLQRFNATGQPISLPIPLDIQFDSAVAPNGAIVASNSAAMLRLFDADGHAATPWFDATRLNPDYPIHAVTTYGAPLSISDDGTIWFVWVEVAANPAHAIWNLTSLHPFVSGDLNGDGRLDNFDIDPFVLALTDPTAFALQYPFVARDIVGDLDLDGALTNFDIDPFVAALIGIP